MKGRKSKLYLVWVSMKQRCCNKNNSHYKYYGGRGIKYQSDWNDFRYFFRDMGGSYSDGLSIDRIDNNGDYCKENCRWVDEKTQQRNKQKSLRVEYRGEVIQLADLADRLGLKYATLYMRLHKYGIPLEDIFAGKIKFGPKGKEYNQSRKIYQFN